MSGIFILMMILGTPKIKHFLCMFTVKITLRKQCRVLGKMFVPVVIHIVLYDALPLLFYNTIVMVWFILEKVAYFAFKTEEQHDLLLE